MLQKAFTLLEIVFVIVIIGIISAVMAPRVKRATMDEMAHQVISDIMYTQQLALNDNKFDPKDSSWYKKRWQIFFSYTKAGCKDASWTYTIFSDKNKDANPNSSEIAKNPLNPSQYLSGGYGGSVPYCSAGGIVSKKITKKMNLTNKYDIQSIVFKGGCATNKLRIYFDYLGRPMYSNPKYLIDKYHEKGNINRLVQNECDIILTNKAGESRTIVITPETGYVYMK